MPPPEDRVLSVMMPVYNEEATLETILEHVLAQPVVGEVVVVDDGSQDATWQILEAFAGRDPRVKIFKQPRNQGKGHALRRAIGEITMPFALVQDADLEYDPRDYPTLVAPLTEGQTDVVYGVRGFAGQTAFNFWFVVGNRLVTLVCNILFNCYISDLETGYKALRSELWKALRLQGRGFDIEPDITARILHAGYRIHEVPIHYYARSREEGKKLQWVDGVKAIWALVKLRLSSPARLFGPDHDTAYHRERQRELSRHHPLVPAPGPGGVAVGAGEPPAR